MRWYKKTHIVLYVWLLDVESLLGKIKRWIWNKHILLWWRRLWLRNDEFHPSLNMDGAALLEMDDQEREKYFADLHRRIEIAHQRNSAGC